MSPDLSFSTLFLKRRGPVGRLAPAGLAQQGEHLVDLVAVDDGPQAHLVRVVDRHLQGEIAEGDAQHEAVAALAEGLDLLLRSMTAAPWWGYATLSPTLNGTESSLGELSGSPRRLTSLPRPADVGFRGPPADSPLFSMRIDPGDPMTRLGYQIPNFTYPGVDSAGLFAAVAAQAAAADRSGFDTVLLMDHFYQLPMLGEPDANMLECYTTLGALSQHTQHRAPGGPGHRQHLPQPGAAGQDRHRPRHRLGRPGPAGHRGRLVRVRAPVAGLRVRHLHRPLRAARGGAPDHPAHAAGRAAHLRGRALPGPRRHQPPGAGRAASR